MTNLAAAVELVAKWRERADRLSGPYMDPEDNEKARGIGDCADELETILAELGRLSLADDAVVEKLAIHLATKESAKCKTLDEAIHHVNNWKRLAPEAREILKVIKETK